MTWHSLILYISIGIPASTPATWHALALNPLNPEEQTRLPLNIDCISPVCAPRTHTGAWVSPPQHPSSPWQSAQIYIGALAQYPSVPSACHAPASERWRSRRWLSGLWLAWRCLRASRLFFWRPPASRPVGDDEPLNTRTRPPASWRCTGRLALQ